MQWEFGGFVTKPGSRVSGWAGRNFVTKLQAGACGRKSGGFRPLAGAWLPCHTPYTLSAFYVVLKYLPEDFRGLGELGIGAK